jgi:hypothetical protein
MADKISVLPDRAELEDALRLLGDLRELLEQGFLEVDDAGDSASPRFRPTRKAVEAFASARDRDGLLIVVS